MSIYDEHVNTQSTPFRDHRRSSVPSGFRGRASSPPASSHGAARLVWWPIVLILLLAGARLAGTAQQELRPMEPRYVVKRPGAKADRKFAITAGHPSPRHSPRLLLIAPPPARRVTRLGETWGTCAVVSSSGPLISDHAFRPRGPPQP